MTATSVAGCATLQDTEVPSEQFLTVHGRKLHYAVGGEGPPIILIHGASGNLRDWTFSLFGQLARTHRVFAMDRPGLGLSDPAPVSQDLFSQADVIHQAAQQLGITRATVVGHSYGGAVALAYALSHPNSVSGMVLLAAPSMVWEGSAGRLYDLSNTPVIGHLFSNLVPLLASERAINRAVSGIFAPQSVPDGYVTHMQPGLSLRPEVFRRNAGQIGALKASLATMEPRYANLTMPIELIHGTADKTVWLDVHSVPFADQHKNARLTILDGVGHMPHHTRPEALLSAVRRIS